MEIYNGKNNMDRLKAGILGIYNFIIKGKMHPNTAYLQPERSLEVINVDIECCIIFFTKFVLIVKEFVFEICALSRVQKLFLWLIICK